jgi:hypothetical protein
VSLDFVSLKNIYRFALANATLKNTYKAHSKVALCAGIWYGSSMEKIVSRPKNEDIGKPLRDRRVPVMVSQDEYAALEGAAVNMGVGVSTYMRLKALEAARAE